MSISLYKPPGFRATFPWYLATDEDGNLWDIQWDAENNGYCVRTINPRYRTIFMQHAMDGPAFRVSWLELLVTTGITKNQVTSCATTGDWQ